MEIPSLSRLPIRLILFHVDGQQLHRVDNSSSRGRYVGVWWHLRDRLLACRQSVEGIEGPGGLLDTDLSHDAVWPVVRQELGCTEETEYFDVPRGRVLFDARQLSGVIYHGNATPREVLQQLARVFGMARWDERRDEHYLTGEALQEFYSLEVETDHERKDASDGRPRPTSQ